MPIRLIRIGPSLLEALAAATFRDVYGADAAPSCRPRSRWLRRRSSNEDRVGAHAPWVGYLVVDPLASVLVGGVRLQGESRGRWGV